MKTRKYLALLLAVVMAVSVLAGCGSSGSAPAADSAAPAADAGAAAPAAPDAGAAAAPATSDAATDLPRNETLYFGGQQWGPINGWNPLSANMNNSMANAAAPRGSRTIMFETLYMFNILDGKLYPLLADGDYEWNDDLTQMTVAIKPAAKWNDGTPVTAEDVVATW